MSPKHFYWLNYGYIAEGIGAGEGSTDVCLPEPITTAGQVHGLERLIQGRAFDGPANVNVRTFTFLREEPDE